MPDYQNGYILTGKGRALQAKAEAGAELKLTRMALGNGTTDSIDEYEEADRLKNQLYSMIISETEQVDKSCTCKASIRSEAVEQGFYPHELGLFAMDGETEILYLVAYDSDPTYVPGKDEGKSVELEFELTISFSTATKVNITLPTAAEELVTLVQNNAIQSVEAAKEAEINKNDAESAADKAEKNMANAALSESNAKASEKAAKETADSIAASTAADAKTATDQAKAAADSARDAATSKNTAEELYRRWCVDIVGPPAASMAEADLFVAPGAAAMAAMGR